MDADDVITLSDDSDVEVTQSVSRQSSDDEAPDYEQEEEGELDAGDPQLQKTPVVKLERLELAQHLDQLSQQTLDDYRNNVKSEIEGFDNIDDEDDDIDIDPNIEEIMAIKKQIQEILEDKPGFEKEVIATSENKNDDEIEILDEKIKTRFVPKNIELKRSGEKEPVTRKLRKKVEPKLKMTGNSFVRRITSKTPVSYDRMSEKTVSSTIERRENKSKLRNMDPSVEEELESMTHSGVAEFLQKKKPVAHLKKKVKPLSETPVNDEKLDSKLQEIENISPSVTNSLRKVLQMTAHSAEEMYRVLDARDKLFKIMRDKDTSVKRAAFVGTCPDMCPEKERLMREFQYQVSIFEMVHYPLNTALDHNAAVKQYSRSSADQEEPLPHELRPVKVLMMTMSYLLHNIVDFCELSDDNLNDWYMFMWDRTRALRKELTQQGVYNLDTVKLVEQCARFHIHCAERLVDQDISVYDDKINTENLTKCLQTLKYMYKDLANEGTVCANEPEFVCYSLLLNLNNRSVFIELSDMSDRVMSSAPVQFALDVMSTWETRNYVRFFNLIKQTTYLNGCLLRRYFNEMRLYATKTMIRSYCTKNYSPQMGVTRFIENFNFEGEEECVEFLAHCNFLFQSVGNTTVVHFDRLAFRNPATPLPPRRAFRFIEEKKLKPFSVIMAGGELPPKSYEEHTPQNSFTPDGELKLDSLLCMDLLEFANMPPPQPVTKSKSSEQKPEPFKSVISASTTALAAAPPPPPPPSLPPSLSLFSEIVEKVQSAPNNELQNANNIENTKPFTPLFSRNEEKPSSTSIFGNNQNSIFGQKSDGSNIFGQQSGGLRTDKVNIFGQQPDSLVSFAKRPDNSNIFGRVSDNSNIFGQQSNNLSIFGQQVSSQVTSTSGSISVAGQKPSPNFMFNLMNRQQPPSTMFPAAPTTNFSTPNVDRGQEEREMEEAEARRKEEERLRLEAERKEAERLRLEREKQDNERRQREEAERKLMIERERQMEEERLRKEREKRELEMRERERLEAERKENERKEAARKEQERREKQEREERERKKRQEELARQERMKRVELARLEELKRQEEIKRKNELAYRNKVNTKMAALKKKYRIWKVKVFFEKWRMKTWNKMEEEKVKIYQEELRLKYPPICSEEDLQGNPYGLIIPSALMLQNCLPRKKSVVDATFAGKNVVIPQLPLIKVHALVEKHLEARIKRLGCKPVPEFPWKLVLSVPDETESPELWKQIETCMEMHFVSHFHWQFGKQKGPLYSYSGCHGTFPYRISIRRLRGCGLYEGSEPNPKATVGSNSLIFVITEKTDSLTEASRRLKKVLHSRPPLPQIPVILFVLGKIANEVNLAQSLGLDQLCKTYVSEYHIINCEGQDKKHLMSQLSHSVVLASQISAPLTSIRTSALLDFCSGSWLDSIWRRMETGLSNYKITLREPKLLIEYYNCCIDELADVFLDPKCDDYTLPGFEFVDLRTVAQPDRTLHYRRMLVSILETFKLSAWPKETPKSAHQLNYRIHRYCKKVTNKNKEKTRNLKWILYRIIRRSLLWKGLDIYCNEDIEEILRHFPWIQVFQELSRAALAEVDTQDELGEEITVIYQLERVEEFSFKPSFISRILRKSKVSDVFIQDTTEAMDSDTEDDRNPLMANDSVISAYSAALEREAAKRKREQSPDEGLDALFASPAGKRLVLDEDEEKEEETVPVDCSSLKADFQSLSDRLDYLKKRLEENQRILIETQNTLQ